VQRDNRRKELHGDRQRAERAPQAPDQRGGWPPWRASAAADLRVAELPRCRWRPTFVISTRLKSPCSGESIQALGGPGQAWPTAVSMCAAVRPRPVTSG
jgi:hypothetical protein